MSEYRNTSEHRGDEVGMEVVPFEGIQALDEGSFFCSFLSTLADRLFTCNTALLSQGLI
jgi:hypothetical protein